MMQNSFLDLNNLNKYKNKLVSFAMITYFLGMYTMYMYLANNHYEPYFPRIVLIVTGVNVVSVCRYGYPKMTCDVSNKFSNCRFCNNYAVFLGISCHI